MIMMIVMMRNLFNIFSEMFLDAVLAVGQNQLHQQFPCSLRLGGVMVTASDLCSTGRGFDSQPFHCQVATMGTCASVTKQYNLVPAKGR